MKKLLSFVLTICMALAMMPAMSITASAAEVYSLYVGGVQVTSDNRSNITGPGIISGSVSYNPATKTLTLNGAKITGATSYSSNYAGIYTSFGLTIELQGECEITPVAPNNNDDSYGIYSGEALTLSGDGELLAKGVNVTKTSVASGGIRSGGNLTISGPAVTAVGGASSQSRSFGIWAGADLTISGSAVTATGGNVGTLSYGIFCGKSLTISGDAAVRADGGNSSGEGYNSFGIQVPNANSSISGGTVIAHAGNAKGNSYGISIHNPYKEESNTLSITGGTVTAKGGSTGTAAKAMDTTPDTSGYSDVRILAGNSESPAKIVESYGGEKFAKFGTMITYDVTYNSNGGSETMTGETAAAGVAFPLPVNAFTPPAGMAFDKWAVGSTDGEQVAANGSYTFTGHTTVYALWKPNKPSAPDMTAGTDSGTSSTDNITNDSTPTFSGTAQPNSQITLISNGNETIGTGTADAGGNWTITAPALADGNYTITAIASDSGKSSDPSPGLSITIDTAAPSGYSMAIDQAAINSTNKAAMSFTFSGAEAIATYNYTVSSSGGGTDVTDNGTIGSTNQQITGIDVSGLGDGTITLSAILTDVAGNTGTAAMDTVIKDTAAPTVSSLSPANNGTDISINADMVITFNEVVTAVAGKNIVIKAVSDDSMVEIIDAADAKVTGSGTATITVNPTVSLSNLTGYYIQIDAGAFNDLQDNLYAGIVDKTSWRFTTTAVPAIYTIRTDIASFNFGSLTTGYASDPAAQTVTVTNTGSQTITLTEPSITNSSSNYNIGFLSRTTLCASETATFTLQPKIGLPVGTYNETINIAGSNGAAASVLAQFSVTPAGGGGGSSKGSTPTLVTKIESGGSVTGTNVDKLVKEGNSLTVEGKAGEKLVFDTEALKSIDGQTKDSLKVEIKDVSADHKSKHPDKLIFSLTMTAGGKQITNFGRGTATVSLPYELKAGEKAEDVTVWYLAEDGTMSQVPCDYDPATKLATFKVNHFSLYVVGTEDIAFWTNPYSDVKESSWFYDSVRFASAKGLMKGTSDTSFNPGSKTTRGMIVSILWRMENEPKAAEKMTFTDVKQGKYYHDAVAWASEKGIASGYSAEQFGPEDSITREQLAVILHNYAASKGYKTDTAADLSAFSDSGKIHSWSKDAMNWINAEGLIKGTGNNLLDPRGNAQRCQVAAILQRFVENIEK